MSFPQKWGFHRPLPALGKGQRGGIVADVTGCSGVGSNISISQLPPDPHLWRTAVLFSEIIDVPSTRSIGSFYPDPFGVIALGVASAAEVVIAGPHTVTIEIANGAAFCTYIARQQSDPDRWSLWRSGFDPIPPSIRAPAAAFKMRLQEALIVPGPDVPFEDVVSFRERHLRELKDLRRHIDRLCISVAKDGYDSTEMRVEAEAFDDALGAYLEEARKPNWKKVLASLDFSMNWAGAASATASAAAVATGPITLPAVASILGVGALAGLGIETGIRSFKGSSKATPFEFVVSAHRDFGG